MNVEADVDGGAQMPALAQAPADLSSFGGGEVPAAGKLGWIGPVDLPDIAAGQLDRPIFARRRLVHAAVLMRETGPSKGRPGAVEAPGSVILRQKIRTWRP